MHFNMNNPLCLSVCTFKVVVLLHGEPLWHDITDNIMTVLHPAINTSQPQEAQSIQKPITDLSNDRQALATEKESIHFCPSAGHWLGQAGVSIGEANNQDASSLLQIYYRTLLSKMVDVQNL